MGNIILMLTELGSYSRRVSLVQGLSFRLLQFHSSQYGKYNADADSALQLLKVSSFGSRSFLQANTVSQ